VYVQYLSRVSAVDPVENVKGDQMKLKSLLNENIQLTTEEKAAITSGVSNFNQYSELFESLNTAYESITEMQKIAKAASHLAVQEGEDWFAQTQIKRDMKEVTRSVEALDKLKEQLKAVTFEAQATYENIGHGLNRYFEIVE